MAGQTKSRNATYMLAVFSNGKLSLQQLVQSALTGKAKQADNRREQYTTDENHLRLINRHRTRQKMLFGQFIVFEPGRKQPLVHLSGGKDFYTIDTKSAEENEAFADEVFYFGIRDNHVVCIQTGSIRARQFETHLIWLLKECSKKLDPDTTLVLRNQPAPEVYKRIQKKAVKSIRVGTPLESFEVTSPAPKAAKEKTGTRKFHRLGQAASRFLKELLDPAAYNQLRFEADLDEANLHMSVEFKFVRKTTEKGQQAIDAIATGLRHIEDTDYDLNFVGGGSIKGTEMKITKALSVKYGENGLVDETDLLVQIHAFMIETLEAQG